MAAPTLVAGKTTTTDLSGASAPAGTTHTINLPSSLTEGDLMIMCVSANKSNPEPTYTTPTNWTKVQGPVSNGAVSGASAYVFTREVPASFTDTTVDLTCSDTDVAVAAIVFVITDQDSTADVSGNATGSSTSLDCPSVTTTVADTFVLSFGQSDDGGDTHTDPGSTTNIGNINQGSTGNGQEISAVYHTEASSGATTAKSYTISASEEWAGITAAWGPSGGGALALNGSTATVTVAAQTGAFSVGAVDLSGATATVAVAAQTGSLATSGAPQALSGATATVTVAAQTGTLSPGAISLSGNTATAAVSAQTGTLSAGAVSLAGATAAVTAAAQTGTLTIGQTLSGSTATVTVAAQTGAFSVGAVTLAGATAPVTVAAQTGTFTTGAVSLTGATGVVTVDAQTGALSTTGVAADPTCLATFPAAADRLRDDTNDSRLHSGDKTFTAGGWFRDDVSGGTHSIMGIWPGSTQREWRIMRRGTSNLQMSWSVDGTAELAQATGPSIAADSWFLLFFEHDADADTTRIWVNGAEYGSGSVSGGLHSGTGKLTLGWASDTGLTGAASRIAYWDRALTADEHADLYENGYYYGDLTAALKTDLVEWWDLEYHFAGQRKGIVLTDVTGNVTVCNAPAVDGTDGPALHVDYRPVTAAYHRRVTDAQYRELAETW